MDFTPLLGRWTDHVLTDDPKQRVRLRMCVNAGVYYLAYAALLVAQVLLGFAPAGPTWALVAAELGFSLVAYATIRSGLNLRFERDPSLTRLQLGVGFAFTLWAYALVGPGASAILLVVASQVVYTMFSLPPREVRWMVRGSLAALAITMLACYVADPTRYPAATQAMAFLYACIVYPLIGSLATSVTSMSEKLRANRRELQAALERVQQLATRDELTLLHNRRHITELMTLEQQTHRRSGQPLCLALLDIDLFKAVNDRHGHQAGDAVLKRFAEVVQGTLRATDVMGRWGGEEFIVMFTQTGSEPALLALQRAQDRLRATSFDDIAPHLRISFSAGLVLVEAQDRLDEAIERADQAMYQAKRKGRGRAEVAASATVAAAAPEAAAAVEAEPSAL